ncbi:hypothetical protein KIPB_002778 [Kipferlia bialata]|uniref:Uncharacterized protein n=2 Tax=Kipferlia bialata TaxID=797122 RepID=A0A9K3CRF1_9EUKA|nr:hypothetical protein KIPB_002778 [Kipferlia bialata]|eukprot:g2778.t1
MPHTPSMQDTTLFASLLRRIGRFRCALASVVEAVIAGEQKMGHVIDAGQGVSGVFLSASQVDRLIGDETYTHREREREGDGAEGGGLTLAEHCQRECVCILSPATPGLIRLAKEVTSGRHTPLPGTQTQSDREGGSSTHRPHGRQWPKVHIVGTNDSVMFFGCDMLRLACDAVSYGSNNATDVPTVVSSDQFPYGARVRCRVTVAGTKCRIRGHISPHQLIRLLTSLHRLSQHNSNIVLEKAVCGEAPREREREKERDRPRESRMVPGFNVGMAELIALYETQQQRERERLEREIRLDQEREREAEGSEESVVVVHDPDMLHLDNLSPPPSKRPASPLGTSSRRSKRSRHPALAQLHSLSDPATTRVLSVASAIHKDSLAKRCMNVIGVRDGRYEVPLQ